MLGRKLEMEDSKENLMSLVPLIETLLIKLGFICEEDLSCGSYGIEQ